MAIRGVLVGAGANVGLGVVVAAGVTVAASGVHGVTITDGSLLDRPTTSGIGEEAKVVGSTVAGETCAEAGNALGRQAATVTPTMSEEQAIRNQEMNGYRENTIELVTAASDHSSFNLIGAQSARLFDQPSR